MTSAVTRKGETMKPTEYIVRVMDDGEVITVGAVFTMDEIERTANALKDAREKMEYWHDKALEYEEIINNSKRS